MNGWTRKLVCLVAIWMMASSGLGILLEQGGGPAEAKIPTAPINLPPNVKHGTEIGNIANFMQHMNNGDTNGMINDVQAYTLGKGMDHLSVTGAWALWAMDMGILAGESALTWQHERVYGTYQRLRQQGYTAQEIKQAYAGNFFSLSERLWNAKKEFPIDTEKEINDAYKRSSDNMFMAFEIRFRVEKYSETHTEEAQKTMLQNAGDDLHILGNTFLEVLQDIWYHGKPPQKPQPQKPNKPQHQPTPNHRPPSNPGGDHPDDNADVSTIEIARDRSLFNAYLRLAQMKNNTDMFHEMQAISSLDNTSRAAMTSSWRSDVWGMADQFDGLFIDTFPDFVAGLSEKALDDLDNFTFTISAKDTGLKADKAIPDKVVKPFSLRTVGQLYGENPSLVGAILESDREGIQQIIRSARVGVLVNGYWKAAGGLLADFGEPVTYVDINFRPEDVAGCTMLIIPSGGLYALDNSDSFRARLDSYARAGGTILVMAQQRGQDYLAAPGGLKAYGWMEDQSCQYSSVGITTYEPFLAASPGATLGLNVDGYFTGWPEGSTIILSRTKNAQPAMLMFGVGKGRVVATSAYEDWAFDRSAASADGRRLLRDIVAWAISPSDIPGFAPSSGRIQVPVSITNTGDTAATTAVIQTLDPDRNPSASTQLAVNIPPGATAAVNFTIDAPKTPGIWWADYTLKNASGRAMSQRFDAARFAVSAYSQNPGGFLWNSPGMMFDITTETEYAVRGSAVNFTIHLYNNGATDKNVSITYDWNHHAFDQKHVVVPAQGKLDVVARYERADSGRFWAWFYDDSGALLGVASKGIMGITPSIAVAVAPGKGGYIEGEHINAAITVSSPNSLGIVTVALSALDPSGKAAVSDSKNIALYPNTPVGVNFNLSLPRTAISGSYLLAASAQAYTDAGMGSARVNFSGGNGNLSGRVVDWLTNASIPGASLTFEGLGKQATAIADAQGNYSIQLQGGYYRVLAKAAGYNTARVMAVVPAHTNSTLDLYTAGAGTGAFNTGAQGFEGSVLTVLGGEGLGGATVLVNLSANEIIVDADKNGAYSILLPPGKFQVSAQLQGSQSESTEAIVYSGRMTHLDLYFDSDIQEGTVTDIVYKTPIAGARLVFDGLTEVITGTDGRYRAPLSAGHHIVSVSAENHAGTTTGIYVAQRSSDLDFYLFPTENLTTGKVTDLVFGGAVAGAFLSFDGRYNVTADAEGKYSVLLPCGYHSVAISAPGYENLSAGTILGERSSPFDFMLKPMTRTITGNVSDLLFGYPLAGALVSFDGSVNVTTAPDGTFCATLPTGYHSVRVEMADYEGVSTGIHVAQRSSPYGFMLKPLTTTINGTVRDIVYNFTVAGALVSFDLSLNTTTDAAGRYTMALTTGYHKVQVSHPSYTTLVTGIHVARRSTDYDYYLSPPSFNLSFANGTVRDLVFNTTLSGARVVFDTALTATTDAGGRYSQGLATGYHSVTVNLTGYDNLTTGIHVAGRSSPYDFWLSPNTATVSGSVRDINDTAGLSGASVLFDGAVMATTLANGSFSVTLATGIHNVAINRAGFAPLQTSVQVTARAGPWKFLLTPMGYTPPQTTGNLTGHVYDLVSGAPVQGMTVWYDGWDRAVTDANGSYSIPYNVGTYRLILRAIDDYDGYDTAGFNGVTIYPGNNTTVDFHQAPTKGNLAGRALDVISGAPLANITIWYDGWDRVTTDENGSYSFRYYAGVKRLIVRATSDHDGLDTAGQTDGVAVYRGRDSVMDFHLEPTKGTLSGTIYDLVSQSPLPNITVWYDGWDRATTDANGSYSFMYFYGVKRIIIRGTDDHDGLDTAGQNDGAAIYRGRNSAMDFFLEPRKGSLSGTVYDIVSGMPVPNTTIWYDGWDRVKTDANGSYSFGYYAGVKRFIVRATDDHDGLDTAGQNDGAAIYRGRVSVMDFYVEPTKGSLSGTVYDSVSGTPVANTTIWYDGWDRVKTDANGSYSFGYYHGLKRILVRETDDHEGLDTAGYTNGVAVYRGRDSVMDIYIQPKKGTMTGTVYDLQSGEPVEGITIWYDGWDRAKTDANGTYSFGYYQGVRRLLVRETGDLFGLDTAGHTDGIMIFRGTTSRIDIYLMPRPAPSTGNISGKVRDAATGNLIAASLRLGGISLATDRFGSFEATLPKGDNDVNVSSPGYEDVDFRFNVPWMRTTDVDIYMTMTNGTGTLSGLVLDKAGRPVGGASVSLYCGYPTPLFVNGSADASGAFNLSAPARSYSVVVSAAGFLDLDTSAMVLAGSSVSGKYYLQRAGDGAIVLPEFELVSLPEQDIYFIGDQARMNVRLRNIGDLMGKAEANLTVPGIYQEAGYAWIPPGKEGDVSFDFAIPDDLSEKEYKAYIDVLGKNYERKFVVRGMAINVSASLDKALYSVGETARLTLNVSNMKDFPVSLFSRVRYAGFDNSTPFDLESGKATTLTFDIPVAVFTGEKLFYSVYTASGRSLYINSLYLYTRPASGIVLSADKQVFRPGEVMTVRLESQAGGTFAIYTSWYSGQLEPGRTATIPVPPLASGTYYINWALGNSTGFLPVDIDGYSARVLESSMDNATPTPGNNTSILLDIEANLPMNGTLNLTIIDPQGNIAGSSSTPWSIVPGENRGAFTVPFFATMQTGVHGIAYCYTALFDGQPVPIVSGARSFDAVDRRAPALLNASQSKSTAKAATIVVSSDEKVTCVVEYGATTSYGQNITSASSGRNVSVTLRGLSPGKTYHYRVKLTDMSGNSVVFQDITVRTSRQPAGAAKPSSIMTYLVGLVVLVLLCLAVLLMLRGRGTPGH